MASRKTAVGRIKGGWRCRLREARLRALVGSQAELARRTGIHRNTLSAVEAGKVFLGAPHALVIAEALGCPLDELYEKRRGAGAVPAAAKADER